LAELEPTPTSPLDLPLRERLPHVNRRSLPRINERFEVQVGDSVYAGVDLSFGGLMCFGEVPVWPGNVMGMSVLLEGETKPMQLEGRVVELVSYRGRIGMRVRFGKIDPSIAKRFAKWMARVRG
jgi:hypothetical protein